jgi:hypothetical protein
MTNEEIEQYPFKHYSLSMTLNEASRILSSLAGSEDNQIHQASPTWEMKSQAQADGRGITRWNNYDRALTCTKPKHYSGDVFIKTTLDWMHLCCAKALDLPRLNDTYIEPTKEQIMATYADKKHELRMIIKYPQRVVQIKSAATKKANAEKLAKAKELKMAEKALKKASMTPEEVADKKAARAQRKIEKGLKLSICAL